MTEKEEDEVRKEVDPAGSFPEAFRIGSLRSPVHIPPPLACVSLDRLDLHVNYNGLFLFLVTFLQETTLASSINWE